MNILDLDSSLVWDDIPDQVGALGVWSVLTDNFTLPYSKIVSVRCKIRCEACMTIHYGCPTCPVCGSKLTQSKYVSGSLCWLITDCGCGARVVDCGKAIRGVRLKSEYDTASEDII